MEYWPAYLLIALFTAWIAEFPLPTPEGPSRDFKLRLRYKLLASWLLAVVFSVMGVLISGSLFLFALPWFVVTGWQLQKAYWEG